MLIIDFTRLSAVLLLLTLQVVSGISSIKSCAKNNGGCNANADCLYNAYLGVVCKCKPGFRRSGSGTYAACTSICQNKNGGCNANAICSWDSSSGVTCTCKPGFTQSGSGTSATCTHVCEDSNGGCDPNADCSYNPEEDSVDCKCKPNYIISEMDGNLVCISEID